MCDVCNSVSVNAYLADRWAKQYEAKATAIPDFLQRPVSTKEVDETLTAVYYGNEGHAFFGGAGVRTYGDLVNRLSELAQQPAHY